MRKRGLAVGVLGLCAALTQHGRAAEEGSLLTWTLRTSKGDRARGRAELTLAGEKRSAALEFELRERPKFVGIVARRVTPACSAHAARDCDLGIARLAKGRADVYYASPLRRKGQIGRAHV